MKLIVSFLTLFGTIPTMYHFTVLILESAYTSSVAVTQDILTAAEILSQRLGMLPLRWRFCSAEGGTVQLQGGMSIKTTKLPPYDLSDHSIWIIPGLGYKTKLWTVSGLSHTTKKIIEQRLKEADAQIIIQALATHAKHGGHIAASCSSVFLLNAAGLLQGRQVTTAWWLAPLLQNIAPDCKVDSNKMVCVDGQITTAGAAFSQTDLMLHLLQQSYGSKLVDRVSNIILLNQRHAQTPFIMPEVLARGNDLVTQVINRIENALPVLPSVSKLAEEFCMSERTLSRHIQRTTGKSTLALLQSVKLNYAINLLKNSRMSIEQIAIAVGYNDATALRRLIKKNFGVNPSHYRKIN